jgi:hypothetical protein
MELTNWQRQFLKHARQLQESRSSILNSQLQVFLSSRGAESPGSKFQILESFTTPHPQDPFDFPNPMQNLKHVKARCMAHVSPHPLNSFCTFMRVTAVWADFSINSSQLRIEG